MSLENTLKVNDDNISGDFIITGEYKAHAVSVNKESFEFKLPFSFELTDSIKKDTIEFDINDFSYEIMSNSTIKVNIETSVKYEINEEDDRKKTKTENKKENHEIKPKVEEASIVEEKLEENKTEIEKTPKKDKKEKVEEVEEVKNEKTDEERIKEIKSLFKDIQEKEELDITSLMDFEGAEKEAKKEEKNEEVEMINEEEEFFEELKEEKMQLEKQIEELEKELAEKKEKMINEEDGEVISIYEKISTPKLEENLTKPLIPVYEVPLESIREEDSIVGNDIVDDKRDIPPLLHNLENPNVVPLNQDLMPSAEQNIISSVNPNDNAAVSYRVHQIKEGQTIEFIADIYKTNIDILAEYNDLSNIEVGNKIIIPEYDE